MATAESAIYQRTFEIRGSEFVDRGRAKLVDWTEARGARVSRVIAEVSAGATAAIGVPMAIFMTADYLGVLPHNEGAMIAALIPLFVIEIGSGVGALKLVERWMTPRKMISLGS